MTDLCHTDTLDTLTGDRSLTPVLQVTPGDSGFYSCVAGNILGESVSTAHLAISPAPRPRPLAQLLASLLCGLLVRTL